MAKTIYGQRDGAKLILYNDPRDPYWYLHFYISISGKIPINGLPKDDIVEGFPISLELTFNGKTIVENLTCIGIERVGGDSNVDGTIIAGFADASEPSALKATFELEFPVPGQAAVLNIIVRKDLVESVFGQPSSEVVDDETTYYYEPVKIVISSVEEDPFAKFVKNYSDKDASEVKAPMFDELKKYLIGKHEISEETAKTAFANCYSITDLLNAICNYVEAHKNAGT